MGNFSEKQYRLKIYTLALESINSGAYHTHPHRGLCSLMYEIDYHFVSYNWVAEESPIIEIAKQRTRHDETGFWFYNWEERKQALINAIREIENEPVYPL